MRRTVDSVGLERYERRWLWGWIVTVLALTMAPYVIAVVAAPPEKVFLGSLLNSDDTAQFLAAMRQGSEGYWLYRNPFTPEDTKPVLMYPLYVVWGRLAGWTGVEPIVAYHLLRAAGVVLLLLVVARLSRVLLRDGFRQRVWRTAFLLVAFSSGLSWLAALLPREIGLRFMADLALIEMSTFQSMLVVPHFAWGLLFELLSMLCFVRAVEKPALSRDFWLWSLSGGLACVGLGLVYPFALVVVYAVLGGFVVLSLVTRQPWGRAALWSAATVAGLGAPVAAYYAFVFWADPLWHSTHVVGNTTGSPPVLVALSGYGLVLVLGIAGTVWVLRRKRWQSLGLGFLVAWAAIQSVLPYVQVSFQGRFAAGWHVAVSMLAALGLDWLAGRVPRRWAQRVRSLGVILTIPSTLLVLLAGPYLAAIRGAYPFYLPAGDLRALDWLAEQVDEADVILASYAMGNTIPTRASCRVFVGHQFSSYRLEEKLALVEAFYDEDTADKSRQAMLWEYGVTWVYYGTVERRIGNVPSPGLYLDLAYDEGGVSIYRVRWD
jgi:hypothetical protein